MPKCEKCQSNVSSATFIVGVVRIQKLQCNGCSDINYVNTLTVPFAFNELVSELEDLRASNAALVPAHIKAACTYLQSQLDTYTSRYAEFHAANRKRRLDLWEKQFIRSASADAY